MRSYNEFVDHMAIEPILLEIAAGIACLNIDPEQWIIEWIRNNNPECEAPILVEFTKLLEEENPFPNRGGFLSGIKNFWNSLKGGAKQGWEQFKNMQTQKVEDAFSQAYRYLDTLVKTFRQDSRIKDVIKNNPQLGTIEQNLRKMTQDLYNMGRQTGNWLSNTPTDIETTDGGPNGGGTPDDAQPKEPIGPNTAQASANYPPESVAQTSDVGGPYQPSDQINMGNYPPGTVNQASTFDQPDGTNVADTGTAGIPRYTQATTFGTPTGDSGSEFAMGNSPYPQGFGSQSGALNALDQFGRPVAKRSGGKKIMKPTGTA